METIDPKDLFLRLGDDEVLVVDCRDLSEWCRYELQIPGALPMSVAELTESAHVLPDDELIVLCGCASDLADARRAQRLLRLRGRDSVILAGGLRGWITSGYPTERAQRREMPESQVDESGLGLIAG